MYLTSFSFKRDQWTLNTLHIKNQCLLVGPNAVGKSKTLQAIQWVASVISGKVVVGFQNNYNTSIELVEGKDMFDYSFEVSNGAVSYECLKINGEKKIQRAPLASSFYGEEVNPPSSRLLLGSRRDTEKYPEVEKIMEFFENVSSFSFSSIAPGERVIDPITIGGQDIAGLFEELSEKDREEVIRQLNVLGFKVKKLHTFPTTGKTLIAMKEEGVGNEFVMWAFSTGLIRVVALLTYLFHLSASGKSGLVLIDDLGEGLDYYRSTRLGKYVCDYCLDKGIQVILTTNDSFLMNVIDIDYWNILSRKGMVVSAVSSQTEPELFEQFRLTGLSNYDLFRSDFIERHRNE